MLQELYEDMVTYPTTDSQYVENGRYEETVETLADENDRFSPIFEI